jgi:hypothetical protein
MVRRHELPDQAWIQTAPRLSLGCPRDLPERYGP